MSQAGARGPLSGQSPSGASAGQTPRAPQTASPKLTSTLVGPAGAPRPSANTQEGKPPRPPSPSAPQFPALPKEDVRPSQSTQRATQPGHPPPIPSASLGIPPRPPALPPSASAPSALVAPAQPLASAEAPVDDDPTDIAAPPMIAQARKAHAQLEANIALLPQMREAMRELTAPLQHALLDLGRRVDELERRHQAAAVILGAGGQTPPLPRTPTLSYPHIEATSPGRPAAVSFHTLDVKAIERDPTIVVDRKLDGRNRRRKLVLVFVLLLLVVFGALGGLLALSYVKW